MPRTQRRTASELLERIREERSKDWRPVIAGQKATDELNVRFRVDGPRSGRAQGKKKLKPTARSSFRGICGIQRNVLLYSPRTCGMTDEGMAEMTGKNMRPTCGERAMTRQLHVYILAKNAMAHSMSGSRPTSETHLEHKQDLSSALQGSMA